LATRIGKTKSQQGISRIFGQMEKQRIWGCIVGFWRRTKVPVKLFILWSNNHMSWELMFFLPRVSNVGAYLVLGNLYHPKRISIIFQVNLGQIRMVATLLGISCHYSLL
jgi:hypothetical protein